MLRLFEKKFIVQSISFIVYGAFGGKKSALLSNHALSESHRIIWIAASLGVAPQMKTYNKSYSFQTIPIQSVKQWTRGQQTLQTFYESHYFDSFIFTVHFPDNSMRNNKHRS